MTWSTPVDLYCERIDPGFWAEPVNALTNFAFLLAAALAFSKWRRLAAADWGVLALIAVTAAIGPGSFAFHTLATREAELLDVVPILVFILGYFLLALRRFLALPPAPALAGLVAFAAFAIFMPRLLPQSFLNGSGGYLPALGALLVVGGLLLRRDPPAARGLLMAAGIFAVSLGLRSIDRAICPAFPLGTHFLWHVLNAVVLYVLLASAIRQSAAAPPAG